MNALQSVGLGALLLTVSAMLGCSESNCGDTSMAKEVEGNLTLTGAHGQVWAAGDRGSVALNEGGCTEGGPCVVVEASTTSPSLRFARPSHPGTYTLSALDAHVCLRPQDAATNADCTAVEGEVVVHEVAAPCVGSNKSAVYSDPCGRFRADIKVTVREGHDDRPGASGQAALVCRDDNAPRWCGGGGGGLGAGVFAP